MRRAIGRMGGVGMRFPAAAALLVSAVSATTTADEPPRGTDDRPMRRDSTDLGGRLRWAGSTGYFILGVAASAKGNDDTALADLDEAIRLDPANAEAYSERGRVWIRKKEMDKALADLNTAIRLKPDEPDDFGERARSGARRRTSTGPSPTITRPSASTPRRASIGSAVDGPGPRRAITTGPSPTSPRPSASARIPPRSITPRGWSRVKIGRVNEAIADYNEAIRLDPKMALAYWNRGLARRRTRPSTRPSPTIPRPSAWILAMRESTSPELERGA